MTDNTDTNVKRSLHKSVFKALILMLIFTGSTISPPRVLHAANSEKSKSDKSGSDLKTKYNCGLSFAYSDNIFGLDGTQRQRLSSKDPDDAVGNRYKDMNSIPDTIISPHLEVKSSSGRRSMRRFDLSAKLAYNHYLKNDDLGYPEGKIRYAISDGEKNRILVDADFCIGHFKKNYLSDIRDDNSNGNISRNERIYAPAVYDEYEGRIAYDCILIKDRTKRISGLEIQPFAGYRSRKYNSKFSNRDYDMPFAGMNFTLGIISKIRIKLFCRYDDLNSTAGQELFLHDETLSGVDVNIDGKLKDNAPCLGKTDRSASRRTFGIAPSIRFSKKTSLRLEYEKRTESYSTDNVLDVARYAQDAFRKQIKTELRYEISKRVSVSTEFSRTNSRDSDDDEYSEKRYLLSLNFDLN